ncbi:MAG: transporter substrate-binding domain-containing protein [Oligoflexales bacterium]|nr:transporter substrate-binding domain-containing protein [Oligoflexales bacterium]
MYQFLKLTLIYSVLVVSLGAQAATAVLGTLTDYKPFTFGPPPSKSLEETIPPGKDSQKLVGYDWDVIRESFHSMGYNINLNVVPWSRGVKMLEKGKFKGLFPTTKTEERMKKYYYSEFPIHTLKVTLYTNKDTKIDWDGNLDTLEKVLEGKIVGVQRDWSYGSWWDSRKDKFKFKIEKVNDSVANFKKLKSGRIHVALGYDITSDTVLQEEKMAGLFKKIGTIAETKEYLATHKELGDKKIIQTFEQGFKKISQSGVLTKIKKKWNVAD